MVVVIIIGIMSVAVVASLNGNNDRAARLQADRFIAVVNEVRDEAIIAGDNFMLIVDDRAGNYRFESIRTKSEPSRDLLLRNRVVGKEVGLKWRVFDAIENDAEDSSKVLISSLGEITSFEARFNGTELSYLVQVNQEGQLERSEKQGGNFQ